ncbi:hypothetical protein [Shewanella sp. 10N.286.54.B9]|uniref:hypothetical protein n=1 Tax=Shewanella sp. 10N.286.54.B9 TaxID=3229719 RepID=UPI00354EDC50
MKPRKGKFAEKSGSYEQALRIKTPVISPGETIEIEQFFTGYGDIKSAKALFYPSDDVFDKDKSYVLNSIKEKEPGLIVFGGHKKKFDNTGITFSLSGIQKEGWEESTLFIDTGEGEPPQILTETKQDEAPFKYHLTTLNNIKPGRYFIEFCFIYYNGESWKSSSKSAEFKIQNFFERNDTFIGWVALAATISALIRFAVIPVGSWLWNNWC